MASSVRLPPWSDIPQDILGLVIARLGSSAGPDHRTRRRFSAVWSKILGAVSYAAARDYHRGFQAMCRARQSALSADRARFRAVCRSWRSAMRQHLPTPRLLPWVIMSDGTFFMPSDDSGSVASRRRLPTLPENAKCIGSTDDWLALDCTDTNNMHTYFLHNPLSNTTVPLPELTGIGNVSELFKIRKVLMRSTPGDIVAIMTNNCNYPIILVWPGKGMWLPEPKTAPFIYIIDIAFIGDKLYGITLAEDLVSLAINFDNNGIPNITGIERLIRHPPRYYRFDVWRDDGQDDDGNYKDKNNAGGEYGFAYSECQPSQEEYEKACALDELRDETGDDTLLGGSTCLQDNEVPYESKDLVTVIWHLIESRGKLLMVRRILQEPDYGPNHTREVEVLEACGRKGAWMPLSDGLGGQALFISKRFSKSISAYEEVKQDTIYFVDTGEMFNVKSKTMSAPRRKVDHQHATWMFSPDLVV